MNTHYISNRAPLSPSALVPLPPGSIRGKGWLAEQLRLQITGLTGHLDALFDEVGPESAWLGGDGEDWERGPYYLRGMTALAYATSDSFMLDKIKPWIEWSLASQRPGGDFGPAKPTSKSHQGEGHNEWWPRMIMLQVMQMHHEATGDDHVLPFMDRYFAFQREELPRRPMKSWAQWRAGDNVDSIHWLYNRTGDSSLLDLGRMVFEQTIDWAGKLLDEQPIRSHVVNLSQGYKQPGVWYAQSKDPRYRDAVFTGIENVTKHHGRIDGMHCGDEAEGGLSGTRGTELCAVTEFMHSLEVLLRIFGDVSLADRLERIAFNALPTLISADWKAHQYFSQPNQVLCTREPHGFDTDHGDDLTYGPLSGYPCCATNMHMGWPKLAHHLWMATPDNGLATVFYTACEVTARVGDGAEVSIIEETDYPFDEQVVFRIRAGRTIRFPIALRVPAWCTDAGIRINDGPGPDAPAGGFVRIEREWNDGDQIELTLPMHIRTSTRENGSIGIERGPLAFALAVEENWRRFPDWRRNDAEDDWPAWEVHPASAWNYGLVIDLDNPADALTVERTSGQTPVQPWSPEGSPLRMTARARRIPDWKLNDQHNAAAPPASPVATQEPIERVTLLPFGSTRLRIAYLPTVG